METTKTINDYNVSIKSDEVWYTLNIQPKNQNWTFWKSEKVYIPKSKCQWLDMDEILEMALEYLHQWVAPQPREETSYTPEVVEAMESRDTKLDWSSFWKYAPIALCLVFWVILGSSFAWSPSYANVTDGQIDFNSRERHKMTDLQKQSLLDEKIPQFRQERDNNDSVCKALCEAERMRYDWIITEMKGEKELIELTTQIKE